MDISRIMDYKINEKNNNTLFTDTCTNSNSNLDSSVSKE